MGLLAFISGLLIEEDLSPSLSPSPLLLPFPPRSLSLSPCSHIEGRPYEDLPRSQPTATQEESPSQAGAESADTLILDLKLPELPEVNACCLSPPTCALCDASLSRLKQRGVYRGSRHTVGTPPRQPGPIHTRGICTWKAPPSKLVTAQKV